MHESSPASHPNARTTVLSRMRARLGALLSRDERSAPAALRDAAARSANERIIAAERAAQKAREHLGEAIDALPQGVVFLDSEGRYILWNKRYAEIYRGSADLFRSGIRLEDTLRIGVQRGDYPEAIGREEAWIAERLAQLASAGSRHEQLLADGRCILIEERRTRDGGTIGLRVDITELKAREASFRLLFESNPVPMFVYEVESLAVRAVNGAALRHYGFSAEEARGLTLFQLYDEAEHLDLAKGGLESAAPARTWRHRKADGGMIDVNVFAQALSYEGRACAIMASVDVTEQKLAERRIAHMARHDALTGLPNRVLYRDRVEHALVQSREAGRPFAVFLVDLDHFKSVNDTFGHSAGDRLLQIVAGRLRGCIPENDLIARLGGDEFAILHHGSIERAELSAIATRIVEAVSQPCLVNDHHALVGASIGISLVPVDAADAEGVLRAADLALYRAKAEGRNAFRFFRPEMAAEIRAKRDMERDLHQALALGQLEVHYQPIVDLASGRPVSCEALLRWRHPERGMVSPGIFIPIAEEIGIIGLIGEFVLDRACRDAVSWPEHVKVSVNLSPMQFRTPGLFERVKAILASTGLDGRRLDLEITETLLMERNDATLSTLHSLRSLGIGICMDDFGTGHSSLNYVRSFPFDKIKIDRAFIHEVSAEPQSMAIVAAILGIGRSLGMQVTAEGIELDSDLDYLIGEGCSEGQGFLFSAARPASELPALFHAAEHRRDAA